MLEREPRSARGSSRERSRLQAWRGPCGWRSSLLPACEHVPRARSRPPRENARHGGRGDGAESAGRRRCEAGAPLDVLVVALALSRSAQRSRVACIDRKKISTTSKRLEDPRPESAAKERQAITAWSSHSGEQQRPDSAEPAPRIAQSDSEVAWLYFLLKLGGNASAPFRFRPASSGFPF